MLVSIQDSTEDCITEISNEADVDFTEEASSVARMVESVDMLSRITMKQSEDINSLNDKLKQTERSHQDLELQVKTAAIEAQKQRLLNSQQASVNAAGSICSNATGSDCWVGSASKAPRTSQRTACS